MINKQIAFAKLSFQSFSEKFVTIALYPKPIPECPIPHFVFVGYFTHDQICNPNRESAIMTPNIEKFITFKKSKPNS